MDPCKVFIKNEPHKVSKLLDDRQRLIFSVSIVDNLLCMLLCNDQNKKEIEEWDTIPSQCGIGFSDDKIQMFLNGVRKAFPDGKIKESDVSGWDFGVKPHDYDFDIFRRTLLNGGHFTKWRRIIEAHYYCMQRMLVALSDGSLYAQVYPGIMKSGWANTSASNSAKRFGAALLARWRVLGSLGDVMQGGGSKTMGDDSVEKPFAKLDAAKQAYESIGKNIKAIKLTTVDDFEFCSMRWVNGTAYPLNEDKQLFNLLHYKPKDQQELDERAAQFSHEFRNSPNVGKLTALILASGWLTQFATASVPTANIGFTHLSFQNSNIQPVLTQMPRDCTETCFSSIEWMHSPAGHVESNTMTNKKGKKSVKATPKQMPKQNPKPKAKGNSEKGAFAASGRILGSSIGGLFGAPQLGGNIGKFLGNGIAAIMGQGDYQMVGAQPGYNVLTNGSQIPKFSTSERTNIICHREYLGDIVGAGSNTFTNVAYPLNPGMSQTFPWLSTVAENFQEYRWHGIIFEFRPLITDFVTSGAPGVVVMATNYNADAPTYSTKQAMENSEFAVSVKPTTGLIHGIECATPLTTLPQRYVRSGAVPPNQDLRLYDYGNFQFANQTNLTQTLGELWVSYCVEFFKPVLPTDVGGNIPSGHVCRSGVGNIVPLGTATTQASGSLNLSVTSTNFSFSAQPGQQYLLNVYWSGTTIPSTAFPLFSYTGVSLKTYWNNDASNLAEAPTNSATSAAMMYGAIVLATITSPGLVTVSLNTSGTLPSAATVDIIVTELDNGVTA